MSLSVRPEHADPRPQSPAPPDDDACCHSGCTPCVYDLYDEALDRYRAELAAWETREAARREQATVAAGKRAGSGGPKPQERVGRQPPAGKRSRRS